MQHPGYSISGVIKVLLNHTDDERFLLARESLCIVLVPGREKALLQNGIHLCLWHLLESCLSDRLRSHRGSFPCLGLSICVCFTCQLTCLSLGWGREVVQDSISCGSKSSGEEETAFSRPLVLSCAWDFWHTHPPSILPYTVCMTGYGSCSCEILFTQEQCCTSCSPNHSPSQLLEQAHCRHCLIWNLRGSSRFPVWCVHLFFILLLHLEKRLDIIPDLALLGPFPPVGSCDFGLLGNGWQRSIVLPG